LITKDAFEPTLPLSVVVHIDYKKAPLVVQHFGDIKRLVEQTLDPMVSAYFKNIAQTKTLIELIQQRSDIQNQSSIDMKGKFAAYSLELQEVLIGTPHSSKGTNEQIEQILVQLRERQVAQEKVATYKLKETAAVQDAPCARPRPRPSSRKASPHRRSRSTSRTTTAVPHWPSHSRMPSGSRWKPAPTPRA
jgi:uncharacterized membrane protein YqiK